MPRDQLATLQTERLRATVGRVASGLPYYAQKMRQAGVDAADIRTLADVASLPFTTKDDLRDVYPYGGFAMPMQEIVRVHASSGTTGTPTVVGYTERDLGTWSALVARFLVAGGLTRSDIVQVAFGYGLFTGGFGLHYGIERVGAAIIPASGGQSERQLRIMKEMKTTAIVCTPSYAVYLGELRDQLGIAPEELALRLGFFGAEPWSERMRDSVEAGLGIFATDNYGLSEVLGPGVAGECVEREGMHVAEDHFLIEVVDPDTLQPLPPGESGELVFTSLTKEAFPVIRYRTRDISRLIDEACPCGRTMRRLAKVTGRTDDMLIIRGVNVFPSQIEAVLLEIEQAAPHYQLVVTREGSLDRLEIRVEVLEGIFFDEMKKLREVEELIRKRVEAVLGLRARIRLVEPGSLERSAGKAQRVLDQRSKESL
jgi:phenylacetate-CoA ligase